MGVTKVVSITIKTDYSTAIAQYLKGKGFEIVLVTGRSPAMTFQMETVTIFTDEVHRFCNPSTRVVAFTLHCRACPENNESSRATGRMTIPRMARRMSNGSYALPCPLRHCIASTPMYNRAFDLCDYLAILFPAICRAALRPGSGDNDADVDWFAEYQRLPGQATLPDPPPYLGILALIDQLKRCIYEANAIALFAAFGLPYNANMTHLAALI
ncbi:hypothetical protein IFM60648_01611 [Aspergillus lentulus]|uniref:Uncharacterized protein n=2 Tax=Aspergillus lentulus TaxID=293939 RepID=A0ABQ0ZV19_ASPLE|nr:hypothetical protein IFM62136_00481 [Aspergillus lentulus]GFF65507.1 hypothetical protein IFM60648_01611 [Aspergillus lentulus]